MAAKKTPLRDMSRPERQMISVRLLPSEVADLDEMTAKLGGDRTGTIRYALNRLKEYLSKADS